MTKNNNMALWDSVCVTDPAMTKRVTQRGGFTSIDSYFTVQRLTEQFGPLGEGWGWDADFEFRDTMVVCRASFWYERGGKRSTSVPILTMNPFSTTDKTGRVHLDDDAGKKALTDAITKWASYLGFSADVFLGKFDDNKYVAAVNADLRRKEEEAALAQEEQDLRVALEAALDRIKDLDSYKHVREEVLPLLTRLKQFRPEVYKSYATLMAKVKEKYEKPESEAA